MSDDPMSLKLDARLVRAGRDMDVKAGDLLIISAGICMGVYTGEMAARNKAVAVAGLRKAKASIAKQRRQKPGPKPRGGKHLPEKKVGPKVAERRTALLKVLQDRGGTAGPDDFKAAGVGRDNEAYTYDAAIHTLMREGVVQRSGGTKRKGVFTLTRRNGAQAPPA